MGEIGRNSEWLRGVLGLCVLRTMADGPTYGYAIATALAAAGLGEIKGGTLYPLLARLEKNELVTTEWRAGEGGPGRKYFSLTTAGRRELAAGSLQWDAFAGTVRHHLATGTGARAETSSPDLQEQS